MFEYLTDTETRESAFLLFNRFYAVPLLIVSNKGIMWVRVPFPHKIVRLLILSWIITFDYGICIS